MAGCPDDLEAFAFVEGKCAPQRRGEIALHLETCVSCRELIAGLLGSDTEPREATGTAPDVPSECSGFRFGAVIAEGGMGRIYRAFDTSLSRDVAIKVPRVLGASLFHRFQREVAITARLSHSGIVPLHGAGKLPDGTPFYVMRFVDGTPLDAAVAAADRDGRLALVERLTAVADTMAYAHREQVVHRDLKPNNVLIGKFGETLIIDWGLAKSIAAAGPPVRDSKGDVLATPSPPSDHPLAATRAGDVLGTPAFMAPEQAAGEPVDRRADVYALGRMLHFVLAGKVAPANIELDAPAALRDVYVKATAFDPDERYADAGELAAALRSALAPAPRARARWPWLAAAIGMAALGAGAWWLVRGRGHREPIELLGRVTPETKVLVLSPSGKRLAIVHGSGIEVRELAGKHTWTHAARVAWPSTVQFEADDVVVFGTVDPTGTYRARWNLATDTQTVDGPAGSGSWLGSLATGELMLASATARGVEIGSTSGTRHVPGFEQRPIRIIAIAPSRQRFAFFDNRDAQSGVIRVVDATTLASAVSPTIADVTALSWLDDNTLVYAAGSHGHSTLYRAGADEHGLASPTVSYERRDHDDWIAIVAARAGRVVAMFAGSEYESRVLDAGGAASSIAGATPLAWRDADHLLTWNTSSHQIEDLALAGTATPTSARLTDEPVNATRARDLLIVAMRGAEGRIVEAIDPHAAGPKWSVAPLAFVRCAGDVEPPCIAGSIVTGGAIELRRIDPETGALGDVVAPAAVIEDAAVDRGGTRLAWIEDFATVHVRPLAGGETATLAPALGGMHSIAFDARGDVVASTSNEGGRQVVRMRDGKAEPVVTDPANVLSLVRDSPDGAHLFYRRRTFVFELAEVHLP